MSDSAPSGTHGVLATYPARADTLRAAVASIAPQLDRLTLVLNEYDSAPDWVDGNVTALIPDSDSKDTGKYLVPAPGAWLFTLDDDILYPPDYVARSLGGMAQAAARLGTWRLMGGYLGWTFRRARTLGGPGLGRRLRRLIGYNPDYIANSADAVDFRARLDRARIVEGLGTGVSVMRGTDAPPFAQVADAQRFIDVRLASWCWERGIAQICLPRPEGWLRDAHEGQQGDNIFDSFTRRPPRHVADEIWRMAFRNPRRGESLDFGFDDMATAA